MHFGIWRFEKDATGKKNVNPTHLAFSLGGLRDSIRNTFDKILATQDLVFEFGKLDGAQ